MPYALARYFIVCSKIVNIVGTQQHLYRERHTRRHPAGCLAERLLRFATQATHRCWDIMLRQERQNRKASNKFDFPLAFGPTMAVNGCKSRLNPSNVLNPSISIRVRGRQTIIARRIGQSASLRLG
jgi:hypothetical protein